MNSFLEEHLTHFLENGKKGFIPYLMAGFPYKKWMIPLILAAASAGAAAIECGVPFSDPIADGPVLQDANEMALHTQIGVDRILRIVRIASKKISVPILLMGYANPFWKMGWRELAKQASRSGVSGLIVADLPVEESADIVKILRDYGLSLVLFCSPTTEKDRMKKISEMSSGFVYFISVKGVTGVRETVSGSLGQQLKTAKTIINKPIFAGFGLSSLEQLRDTLKYADGGILGSKIASFLNENKKSADLDRLLFDFLTPWIQTADSFQS